MRLSILPAERTPVFPVLALLLWGGMLIGFGLFEAHGYLVRDRIDKLSAQADLIRTSLESFLAAGLPLTDFQGFERLADPMFRADPGLLRAGVRRPDGTAVFEQMAGQGTGLPPHPGWQPAAVPRPLFVTPFEGRPWSVARDMTVRQTDDLLRVEVPLGNRFETEPIGFVWVDTPRQDVDPVLVRPFGVAALVTCALVLFYVVLHRLRVAHGDPPRPGEFNRNFTVLAVLCVIVAGLAVHTVNAALVREKAAVLSQSLAERLGQAVDLGLDLTSFDGIEQLFAKYRDSNPDVDFVTLVVGKLVALSSGQSGIGQRWMEPAGHVIAVREVQPRRVFSASIEVALGIDRDLITQRMFSVTARLAPFAGGLVVVWIVFINIIRGPRRRRLGAASGGRPPASASHQTGERGATAGDDARAAV